MGYISIYKKKLSEKIVQIQCNSHLKIKSQYIGYQGDAKNPSCILLKNNNLHIEILVNKEGNIGAGDNAGIDDIIIESALTTIQDCEDS